MSLYLVNLILDDDMSSHTEYTQYLQAIARARCTVSYFDWHREEEKEEEEEEEEEEKNIIIMRR